MRPGLYRVSTGYFCAGLVIGQDGLVEKAAPILWRTINQCRKDGLEVARRYGGKMEFVCP